MLLGPQPVTAMSYHSSGLLRSRASVASFQEWKAEEAGWREGKKRGEDLAEYATLALRLNPAVGLVDNQSSPAVALLGSHFQRALLAAHIMATRR